MEAFEWRSRVRFAALSLGRGADHACEDRGGVAPRLQWARKAKSGSCASCSSKERLQRGDSSSQERKDSIQIEAVAEVG